MKKFLTLLILFTIFVNKGHAKNYAILISPGAVHGDNIWYQSEFWYDLFLAYENLVKYKGYDPADVFVFYNTGTDYNSSIDRFKPSYNGWNKITDYPTTLNDLKTQFTNINTKMTTQDNLIVFWVIGHGSDEGSTLKVAIVNGLYYCLLSNDLEMNSLYVSTIKDLLNRITNYNNRLVIWNTCFSGMLVSEDFGANTTILASTKPEETGHSAAFGKDGIPISEFGYHFNAMTEGFDFEGTQLSNIDEDKDGYYML
jgi:hypothetical protein